MSGPTDKKNIPAAEVIDLLIQGNVRFVSGLRSVESFRNFGRMKTLATQGQFPFVTLVTCSDSRIPIEQVFDRGMGELFVVRTFGNVIDPLVVGSIEYAALNFNSEVVVVMGHSRSGAIRTTLEQERKPAMRDTPSLQATVEKVRPSLNRVRTREGDFAPVERKPNVPTEMARWENLFQKTLQENVRSSVRDITEMSLIVQERVSKGQLFIVPAVYSIDTGQVIFEIPAALAAKVDRKVIEMEAFSQGKLVLEIFDKSLKVSGEDK